MREMLGVGFEDKVFVERYIGGELLDVGNVVVGKTVSPTDLERLEEGWKWFLEHIFSEFGPVGWLRRMHLVSKS
jgi:hypothetical protein